MGTKVCSWAYSGKGVKLTTDEVKNEWNYTSTPLTCLNSMERDNFTKIKY
jgi:hypothetical protein